MTKRLLALSVLLLLLPGAAVPSFAYSPAPDYRDGAGDLSVYYMNWSVYSDQKQQVRDLPWDRISTINHAFWLISPNDDMTEFPIESCDTNADLKPGGCFDQYTEMKARYPAVTVVISIGGWGSKWFPEMSQTAETRATFIASCLDLMDTYPFIGGIDVDWEYPRAGERDAFTALMREFREAFEQAGRPDAVLSFCASTGVNSNPGIDFAAVHGFINRVNIMTYDMSGPWTKKALHHASLYPGKYSVSQCTASEAAEHLLSLGVPPEKVNIGSPLYSHGWVVDAQNGGDALGKAAIKDAWGSLSDGELNWHELRQLENTPGWEVGYDEEAGGAYLFCSNPDSGFYQSFYSYESNVSLQAKLDYINEKGLGGLIVWSTSGDRIDADYPMLTQMAAGLGLYDGAIPVYAAPPFEGGPDPKPPQTTPFWDPSPREKPSPVEQSPEPEEPPVSEDEEKPPLSGTVIVVLAAVALVICGGIIYLVRSRRS